MAENTDLIVAPTPTGVEMMTDMRSAEAPMTTTYKLSLPDGASLKAGLGGSAEVVDAARVSVQIPPPVAIDAAGEPVKTVMTIQGDQLEVAVSPEPDTQFPILVDPTYKTEAWNWMQGASVGGWTGTTTGAAYQPIPYQFWAGPGYPGLDLTSGGWANGANGTHADWTYAVPRYNEDMSKLHGEPPSTWIYQMVAEGVQFHGNGNLANYPALVMGLADPFSPSYWEVQGVHYGGQGEMTNWNEIHVFTNENEQANDKLADMDLVTYENEYPAKSRDTYMPGVALAVVDTDKPRVVLNAPRSWTNTTPVEIPYEFEDPGLGVRMAVMSLPGHSSVQQYWGFENICTGSAVSPCPRLSESSEPGAHQMYWNPSELPTGRDHVTVTVGDPIWGAGHTTEGTVVLKVDHTAPEVSLSGSLTEQGVSGTRRPSYALRINAKDGVEGAPQSGVAKIEVLVDGKRVEMPEGAEWEPKCQSENCAFNGEWSMSTATYGAGAHEVKVIATDAVGNQTTKTMQVELHPPAPELALSGALTEQATLGTELPSYKLRINASALAESPAAATLPTYSSSFGGSGIGNGLFARPGGVAVDSQGDLWVADSNNNRIEEFSEAGAFIRSFGTKGSGNGQLNHPTAIAIAANGNLWVTDSLNRRVEEFSPTGAYLAQFGSQGTGNGQFAASGPESIAIDYHGNIWVADTYGGRLEKFNESGGFIRSVGTIGSGPEQLRQPDGIAIASGGNVFVTDWEDNKVAEYGEGGKFVREFGSRGSEPGQLQQPTGIAIDSRGDVWVADQNNGRIEEFSQAGEYLGRFGAKGSGAGQFELSYPTGIATDAKGDIWITDAGDNRVEKWIASGYVAEPTPTLLRSFGSTGTGNGQFQWAVGAATDGKGNLWVSDFFDGRIERFNEQGQYVGQFGTQGAANGQFKYPFGVAVDPKGHVWVADDGNNRIEEFSETGAFIRSVGTLGSGQGQLSGPLGIAIDAKNDVWVTDTGNGRIEEFGETGAFIRAFGTKSSGPGQLPEPYGIAVTPTGNIWVTDNVKERLLEFTESGALVREIGGPGAGIGQFDAPTDIKLDAAGNLWVSDELNHRIEEFNPQGEFIRQFGSQGAGAGQFENAVDIALDGKGHLFAADRTNNRISEWTLPPAHSQVSAEVTVDGKRMESFAAACASETCTMPTKEWTLLSSSLSAGNHQVVVRATDGLGNTTSKTLNIRVGDTTKPGLEVGGELAQAPEGWIEQAGGSYGLHASATDSGYGVTSLAFDLDGKAVAEKVQACAAGACSASISTTVNAQGLTAGEHPAEVVAKDGAGNVATKKWTINVDPDGHIATGEALATVEAAEGTSGTTLVTPQSEELEGLGVEAAGSTEYRATGTNVPLTISRDPSEGFELEVLAQGQLGPPCDEEMPKQPDSGEGSGASPPDERVFVEEEEKEEECVPMAVLERAQRKQEVEVAEGLKRPGLAPITIEPRLVSSEASSASLVNGESTLAANTGAAVDTVTRPLADGGLTFASIREASAPEHYAYEMDLSPELELRSVDSTHVEAVYKAENVVAFTIEAVPAHDAIGTTVPTRLEVTGADVITLTVEHRSPSPAGGPFVYPVIGGAGWQGGYRTISVELAEPPPPTEEDLETYELEQMGAGKVIVGSSTVGPPEETQALSKSEALALDLNPATHPTKSGKRFEFMVCRPHSIPEVSILSLPRAEAARVGSEHLHFHCHDPSYGGNYWTVAVYGKFHYVEHHPVWLNWKEWNCDKITGELRHLEFGVTVSEKPTLEHCDAFYPNKANKAHYPSGDRFKGPIYALGEYRFPAGSGQWPAEAETNCLVVGGELYPNPRVEEPLEEPLVYERPYQVMPGENCGPIN